MKSVLLHYAQACKNRPKSNDIRYDYAQSMNMIEKDGVAEPFIDSMNMIEKDGVAEPFIDYSKNMMALMTKTESARERDDAYVEMMALQTKTFTNMERDDQDFAYHQ